MVERMDISWNKLIHQIKSELSLQISGFEVCIDCDYTKQITSITSKNSKYGNVVSRIEPAEN